MVRMCWPDRVVWIDGSEEEKEEPHGGGGGDGRSDAAQSRETARLPLSSHGDQRRGPHRRSDLHLHHVERRRRADEQLDVAGRRVSARPPNLRRLDARPHHVRDPLFDGAGRLALQQDRRGTDRQRLRRAEHAHYDARRRERAEAARRGRTVHQVPARQGRPRHQAPSDSALSRRQHDLERRLGLRRQRLAGREVPGLAHRQLPRPARGLVGRAYAGHGR